MHIHIISFEYFYKNAPDVIIQDYSVIPVGSSAEARVYFWLHIAAIKSIQWAELDSLRITQVRSTYVDITA